MQAIISSITNTDSFFESLKAFASSLSFSTVIMLIMVFFMFVGAIDKIRGNKKGYGEAFDEGFNAMGPLAIAMVGAIAASPVLCVLLEPVLTPVYEFFGASPAVFATTLLAADMGGYPLAVSLAGGDEAIGMFAGLIVGTTMGCIILFDIPLALSIIKDKQDRSVLACGILLGLVTVPLGCLAGGLCMSATPYKLSFLTLVQNTIPVTIVAVIIAAGLWFIPTKMMSGFNKFGTGVTAVIAVCVCIAVLQYQTGIRFPLLDKMITEDPATGISPLQNSLLIIGNIALVLIGAFPMVEWVKKAFKKPLGALGRKMGMDEIGCAAMIANLANNIPVFAMFHDMSSKGKLINAAFATCAAFALGDHLGFAASIDKDMIVPVIAAKLVCGITAVALAILLSDKLLKKAGVEDRPL